MPRQLCRAAGAQGRSPERIRCWAGVVDMVTPSRCMSPEANVMFISVAALHAICSNDCDEHSTAMGESMRFSAP